MIKKIIHRIISDYFLFNRIKKYDYLIQFALKNNYQIMRHSDFYKNIDILKNSEKKIMLIRHDIDSDPKFCKHWIRVDKKYNIKTSYYFRLCTVDDKIMNEINKLDFDCGYHFEEIANFAKKNKILSKDEMINKYNLIRELFSFNLKNLESKLNFKIKSIASHGDFANRKLNLPNWHFIDKKLLSENGLEFECYQDEFISNYSINISDCEFPYFYKGKYTPEQAIKDDFKIIHVLLHPRSWRSNWKWNTYENIKRFIEGLNYR